MLCSKWYCMYTFLALFATLSISTIDATLQNKSAQIYQTIDANSSSHDHDHESAKYYRTILVDQSGTTKGCFKTIQAAVDSVPENNNAWIRIHVKNGLYREVVRIPKSKPFIFIEGDGENTTKVVWDGHETIANATFSSLADYTIAKAISFINSYNHAPKATSTRRVPAVAAFVYGDKSAFYRCGFYGVQDTLWDERGRHYFKECTIEGAVDFIFGRGQSQYEGCRISVVAGTLGTEGYVTAQGREKAEDTNGFVFKNCNLDGSGKVYLGRAWRTHARVLFYDTYMSGIVVPQGWKPWNGIGHEKELTFAENNCSGPGSDTSKRVSCAKKLSVAELEELTTTSFIDNEGWMHHLPSDFFQK